MFQVYLTLALSIITAVSGQFLLKKGMILVGGLDFSFRNILFLIPKIFQNLYLFLGLFAYVLSFFFWLFVLSKLKLSIAFPITSLNYVLIVLVSWLALKESISLIQILGILAICLGIFLLTRNQI